MIHAGEQPDGSWILDVGHDEPIYPLRVHGVEAAFDPDEHPRGKTTQDSTPGSFAPAGGDNGQDPDAGAGTAGTAGLGGQPGSGAEGTPSTKAFDDRAISLGRLNDPKSAETIQAIYGRSGELVGTDTLAELKIYPLQQLIDHPELVDAMLHDYGFEVKTFSFENDPEKGIKFQPPNLKQSYAQGVVWVYDPRIAAGSFEDEQYTRAWRTFHEVGHGLTESFMQERYGDSKREGRLGVESKGIRGNPAKRTVEVPLRALTLGEAQRAVEWEDTAFRAQRQVLDSYGVHIPDTDFAREYNVNLTDAVFRVTTGGFGDPGHYGYRPATHRADLKGVLTYLQHQEESLAKEQGRAPTKGIDLSTWKPISDAALTAQIATHRRAKEAGFDPALHPHQPGGDEHGGEFAPTGGGAAGAAPKSHAAVFKRIEKLSMDAAEGYLAEWTRQTEREYGAMYDENGKLLHARIGGKGAIIWKRKESGYVNIHTHPNQWGTAVAASTLSPADLHFAVIMGLSEIRAVAPTSDGGRVTFTLKFNGRLTTESRAVLAGKLIEKEADALYQDEWAKAHASEENSLANLTARNAAHQDARNRVWEKTAKAVGWSYQRTVSK